MDFSKENLAAKQAANRQYAEWYSQLPDERKAEMLLSGYEFAAGKIRYDIRKENPFATDSDVRMRFIELTQGDYPESTMNFIRQKMKERSEADWQKRFKAMKKVLGWSYEDMARFMGASGGDSVKASVNRQLPAFAKLAVCLFEKMQEK